MTAGKRGKIRVLIAEDSPTVRALIASVLTADSAIEVIGEARDGVEAVELTRKLRPDVVTMDIRMPRLDGLEATKQIMTEAPTPIVLVSDAADIDGVSVSMAALRVGATTVVAKPSGPASPDFAAQGRRFADTVKAMSEVRVVRRWSLTRPRGSAASSESAEPGSAKVVAIAASTGGPAAIYQLLSELPGDFPSPILIVQHITPGFVGGFVQWLNAGSRLSVRLASHGEPLRSRTVYVAPDDHHLGVSRSHAVALSKEPPVDGHRPSGSHLFRSVAEVYGASALGVILTGMGQDGVEGLRELKRSGARIIAQNEASSVVFGMPGAAVRAGLADVTLPLDGMAQRIVHYTAAARK